MVDDAEGNLNFIETEKQIIFICTDSANDYINRQIMNAVQYKMNKVRNLYLQDSFMNIFLNLVWCFT